MPLWEPMPDVVDGQILTATYLNRLANNIDYVASQCGFAAPPFTHWYCVSRQYNPRIVWRGWFKHVYTQGALKLGFLYAVDSRHANSSAAVRLYIQDEDDLEKDNEYDWSLVYSADHSSVAVRSNDDLWNGGTDYVTASIDLSSLNLTQNRVYRVSVYGDNVMLHIYTLAEHSVGAYGTFTPPTIDNGTTSAATHFNTWKSQLTALRNVLYEVPMTPYCPSTWNNNAIIEQNPSCSRDNEATPLGDPIGGWRDEEGELHDEGRATEHYADQNYRRRHVTGGVTWQILHRFTSRHITDSQLHFTLAFDKRDLDPDAGTARWHGEVRICYGGVEVWKRAIPDTADWDWDSDPDTGGSGKISLNEMVTDVAVAGQTYYTWNGVAAGTSEPTRGEWFDVTVEGRCIGCDDPDPTIQAQVFYVFERCGTSPDLAPARWSFCDVVNGDPGEPLPTKCLEKVNTALTTLRGNTYAGLWPSVAIQQGNNYYLLRQRDSFYYAYENPHGTRDAAETACKLKYVKAGSPRTIADPDGVMTLPPIEPNLGYLHLDGVKDLNYGEFYLVTRDPWNTGGTTLYAYDDPPTPDVWPYIGAPPHRPLTLYLRTLVVQGVATATANLDLGGHMNGQAAGSSAATAALRRLPGLAGQATGSGAAVGVVSGIPNYLGAHASGAATAAAPLGLRRRMATQVTGTSLGYAWLRNNRLQGSAAGRAGVYGRFGLSQALAGEATGTASASADLTMTYMACHASGSATVQGNLSFANSLSGRCVGVATTQADLSKLGMRGQAAGSATARTVPFDLVRRVSGQMAGIATAQAAKLVGISRVGGQAAGAATAQGTVSVPVTKQFTFASSAESWSATPGNAATTMSYDGSYGDPSGALKSDTAGSSKASANYWEWTGTWEALGVPSGATVTQIRLFAHEYRCTLYTGGNTGTTKDGSIELRDSGGTLQATLWSGAAYTAAHGAWQSVAAQSYQAVPAGMQASTTTIKLRLNNNTSTSAGGGNQVTLYDDQISFQMMC